MRISLSKKSSYLYRKRWRFNLRRLIIPGTMLICILSVMYINSYQDIAVIPSRSTITLPGHLTVIFPKQGESAIGTSNFGVISSSPNQSPVPIASLAKIMAAYLVLKAHPLQPGENGPSVTITAKDTSVYLNDLAESDSVLPIAQGEKLNERQLLEGLMLPSGDNIAHLLGEWVSGSDAAFIKEMNKTAQSLGMMHTHYADISGANPATVSDAVDQLKIAQIAMENPVFREIVAMPQVTLPVAGTVFNVDSMLGKHGIVGIKTGSSLEAGGCFASAAPVADGARSYYIIGVVLGQKTGDPLQTALRDSAKMLAEVRPEFRLYPIASTSTAFGQVVDSWHSDSPLYAATPAEVLGYPGMTVNLFIKLTDRQVPISPDTDIATLKVESGGIVESVPLRNSQQVDPPGFFWRLFR